MSKQEDLIRPGFSTYHSRERLQLAKSRPVASVAIACRRGLVLQLPLGVPGTVCSLASRCTSLALGSEEDSKTGSTSVASPGSPQLGSAAGQAVHGKVARLQCN